ncbi:MAG TPA: zinc ribbon domain-containing protein [Saprospiraceae bacterium]|nr:zinc ribbon domain-containing protein [Saprospiraceae bacterium]
MTTYKNCQSCGMPLKKDPEHGGTEANGTKSLKYCSKCYTAGKFNNPEINTPQKIQSFVKEKIKSMGFPGFLAGMFVKGIPSLERWKGGSW